MNNKNKRTNQKGFTLIELMIVVAIIGVLSAIAVPAYKDYVSKSELASGFATIKSVITPAELYVQENGVISSASPSDLGVSASSNSLGVLSITTTGIVFTHNNGAVSGASFTYTRHSDSGWTCSLKDQPNGVDAPKGCS
ncbi:Fimbrial protein precursor [Vibrio coralliirubri]|uniref:pilin n=1 Tax=Vibrio coralliirubri TaxID=1516159 RepID=UPI000633DE4B|nr:pilin [Vibrio coralliirubri]CDT90720.1 Fimbrial protein precursor [Vibrio coralliirubri]